MGHWVAEPCKQLAAVSQDVTIVHRDHVGFPAGQHVTETQPQVPALAGGTGIEIGFDQLVDQAPNARPVVPNEDRLLRKLAENLFGALPARRVGTVNADHDLPDVLDIFQFLYDSP